MLFRHHDAAALPNALNGLFDADAVVIGGRGGVVPETCPRHESQPAPAPFSQPDYPTAKRPTTSMRTPLATATPSASPALWRMSGGPAARVWASWVVSRAVTA